MSGAVQDFSTGHFCASQPQARPQSIKKEDRDLSFPVPYQEHAKYLQLANDFLASGIDPRSDNVIPIDRDQQSRMANQRNSPETNPPTCHLYNSEFKSTKVY